MTDKILPQIEDWQNRPLDEVYPILYIDAIHYSVRDNGVIRKLAAYVILGINTEGKKEVLTISVGDNESAKYWLSVMNELKNRGVKDVLIICADGLTGIKEAIAAAFPKTEYQRCIVHQVRNTLKYVPDKDRKAFATDLKTIYQATDEKKALAALERVTEKWTPKYPNSMKRWKDNWDAISPIFKFSTTVRTVIYTTNAIESLLTISVGDNESAKYWLSVMNELKNRGVKDVLIICADGLTGIKEAIAAAFPKTEYQRCIVHQVRNTLKYVPDKDRKAFATDLKTIYQATDEKKALAALERVTEKWTPKYPNSMKRWKDNWDAISPIFKFSTTVRTVIYTTNAIESLNSTYRKLNRQRSVFPSDTALLKALYLTTFEATKKWTSTIRNWAQVYGELSIMYEGRLPE